MTELDRLLEVSDSARTRELLRAGRAERSPAGFSQSFLASVGVAAAASASAGSVAASLAANVQLGSEVSGAAASSVVAPSLALVAAKWVAIGVVGGGILAAGAELSFSPEPEAARPTVSKPSVVPSASPPPIGALERDAEPAEPAAPASVVAPSRAPATPPSAAASGSHAGQLGHEVLMLDGVRSALAAGKPALALSELDAYARATRTGVLDREARVLRIEALRAAGDEAGARQLATKYQAEFPNDAHAPRLRAKPASP